MRQSHRRLSAADVLKSARSSAGVGSIANLVTHKVARVVILATLCVVCHGCDSRFNPRRPEIFAAGSADLSQIGVGNVTQLDLASPLFGGLSSMVAGDESICFGWEPALDDNDDSSQIIYNLYWATAAGEQDFTTPNFVSEPGETHLLLPDFDNGTTIFAVVRAVDSDGNEDFNTHEWPALPNPVLYVASGATGSGDSPSDATSNINIAAGLDALNIYVAEGLYSTSLVDVGGVSFYGGFDSSFDVEARDPIVNVTEISPLGGGTAGINAVDIDSTSSLSAIDGFVITGGGIDPPPNTPNITVGVEKDSGFLRVTRCELRQLSDVGVNLSNTGLSVDPIVGYIRDCSFHDIAGEAVVMNGSGSVFVDNNRIVDCGQEGIEAQSLLADPLVPGELEITRNIIDRVVFEGIDVDITATGSMSRVRILVRNNQISNSELGGINIDLDFASNSTVDLRSRIEDNTVIDNRGFGINLDADAASSFRVARNVVSANLGAGINMSGTLEGPTARLLNNRICGNFGAGVRLSNRGSIEIRHCLFLGNGGPAIIQDRFDVDVTDSVLVENGAPSSASQYRYSLLQGDSIVGQQGPGIITGEPLFTNEALEVAFVTVGANGTLQLADTSTWQVGDTVEINEDDVPRIITARDATSVTIEPAPAARTTPALLGNFGDSPSVISDNSLQPGSPAIDAGDIEERDSADATLPDLGPQGGSTPGNIGIETGLGTQSAALELVRATPSGSGLQTSDSWLLRFNRNIEREIAQRIRLRLNDFLLPGGAFTADVVDGAEDTLQLNISTTVGDKITIEFLPYEPSDPELVPLLSHFFINARRAENVGDSEPNDSLGAAQSIIAPAQVGGVVFGNDADVYSVSLLAGQTVVADLVSGGAASTLIGRLSLLSANGTTLQQIDMGAILPVDALLAPYTATTAQQIFLRVDNIELGGFYFLLVDVR